MICVVIGREIWTTSRKAVEMALRQAGYTAMLFDPDSHDDVDVYCTTEPVRCSACQHVVEFGGRPSLARRRKDIRVTLYPLRCSRCGAVPGGKMP